MTARPLALVVEDSADQLELLRFLLAREGFDVFAALDAESAVEALDTLTPSLAVIDLLLPGMSGSECAQRVRERVPGCRIVISSVLDEAEYPAADAALPKPVRGSQVHDMLLRMAQ